MSPCPSENRFAGFLEGQLSGPALHAFFDHVGTCEECAAALAILAPREASGLPRQGGQPPGPAEQSSPAECPSFGVAGRYRALKVLGAGGMGIVYLARDTQLNRNVAVKVTRAGVTRASALRLLREAQAMARLSHRNVVGVYDVGMWHEHVFLAMEYLDGGTLNRYLLDRKPPWPAVLDKFLQAGRGLAAAHGSGLAHRDFKTDNVLLTCSGEAKVADFGLARALGETSSGARGSSSAATLDVPDALGVPLTHCGAVVGTPAYMAPEQIRGDPVDHRADVWSFCAALYEALYCELPFPGRTPGEVLRYVEIGSVRRPPLGSDVPRWLRRALLAGLRPDPASRISSMEALLGRLERSPSSPRYLRLTTAGLAAGIVAATALGFGGAGMPAFVRASDPKRPAWFAGRPPPERGVVAGSVGATPGAPRGGSRVRAATPAISPYRSPAASSVSAEPEPAGAASVLPASSAPGLPPMRSH